MQGRPLPLPPGGRTVNGQAVDFLLPTGFVIPMQANPRATLRDIKEDLFHEAKKYPLFALLKDQGFYNFLGGFWLTISHGGSIEPSALVL